MKRSNKQRIVETGESTHAYPAIGRIAVLAWALIVLVWFFYKARIPFAPIIDKWLASPVSIIPNLEASLRHAKHLLALAGVTAALLGIGHRLLRLAGVQFNNGWEELSLSFGLGYGAAGTLLFLLGLAGLWPRNFLLALLAGASILAIRECRNYYQRDRPPVDPAAARFTIPALYGFLGFIVIWLSMLRDTLIPETFYDALQYHLGLPSIYLLNGRIIPTPENSYSGIPGLPQMLYGWTLALDPWGITAYLLHHSMVLWVGAAMIGFCRRLRLNEAGPLAAAFFFIVPIVQFETFSVSVGMEWALMELCWFIALVCALTEAPGTALRTRWLVLSGAFLGFAISTKYQAWLLPAAVIPLLFIRFRSESRDADSVPLNSATAKEVLMVLSVAALCLAPWVAKNFWFYKNPLYPFFHEFFVSKAEYMPNWRAMMAGGMAKGHGIPDLTGLLHYAAFPARFLFSGDIFQSTGLVVVCLAPLIFWAKLPDAERLLAWIALVAWVSLSFLTEITRYFIPHLALTTLLICCIMVRLRPLYVFSDFGNFLSLKFRAIAASVPYCTHNAEPSSRA